MFNIVSDESIVRKLRKWINENYTKEEYAFIQDDEDRFIDFERDIFHYLYNELTEEEQERFEYNSMGEFEDFVLENFEYIVKF